MKRFWTFACLTIESIDVSRILIKKKQIQIKSFYSIYVYSHIYLYMYLYFNVLINFLIPLCIYCLSLLFIDLFYILAFANFLQFMFYVPSSINKIKCITIISISSPLYLLHIFIRRVSNSMTSSKYIARGRFFSARLAWERTHFAKLKCIRVSCVFN